MSTAKLVVGLTGLIGSGKSIATKYFTTLGANIIDTDVISHQITQVNGKAIAPIIAKFGQEFIVDGALDRNKMRELVFSDSIALVELENILHPLILAEVKHKLSQNMQEEMKVGYTILVVPLLFKSPNYLNLIERSIFVDCELSILIPRVIQRTGLKQEEIEAILEQQIPRHQQLQLADDILYNNGSVQQLNTQVIQLDHKYKNNYKL